MMVRTEELTPDAGSFAGALTFNSNVINNN